MVKHAENASGTSLLRSEIELPYYVGGRHDICAVDMTPFTARRSEHDNYTVVSQRDFQLRLVMASLEAQWAKEEYHKWRVEYAEAGTWYVQFLAKRITSQFNLDPLEGNMLEVLIAMFWNNLILDGWSDLPDDKRKVDVIKYTYTTADIIDDMFAKNLKYGDINELANSIATFLSSPKLRGFDSVTLVQLTGSASFGVGVDVVLARALEYPPYWVALMYVNMNDKSYRNTFLARLVKKPSARLGEEITRLLKGR